ncbi:unnamed protein product [Meloidogyne enterolobii]|uniref:Uncharacterized protein n=1 Tax=Meloidogyne enterolobii TaxID=390850 RepID=A0ACB1AKI6_MELEN
MALKSVSTKGGEANIKEQLKKFGPVSAGFYVYEDFNAYKDGVYYNVKGKELGGHAVVITGYGTATCGGKKIPFWIIRNSWGPKWGMGGFFYMRRGTNDVKLKSIFLMEVFEVFGIFVYEYYKKKYFSKYICIIIAGTPQPTASPTYRRGYNFIQNCRI